VGKRYNETQWANDILEKSKTIAFIFRNHQISLANFGEYKKKSMDMKLL
jgi:hypothetical protein